MKKLTILLLSLLLLYPLVLLLGCNQQSETYPVSSEDGWITFTNGNEVNSLLIDEDVLWAATGGGVVRWDINSGSYKKYTTLDGLAENNVMAIAQDSQGNIICGTQDGGINSYDGANWNDFPQNYGLGSYDVLTIIQDSQGDLWFGSGHGISRYDGSEWSNFSDERSITFRTISAIFEDNQNNLWFGGSYGYIILYDGAEFTNFATLEQAVGTLQRHYDIMAIRQDNQGNLWVGTEGAGVCLYDGTDWQRLTTADGLAGNTVLAIVQDDRGSLWFGTDGGASCYDGTDCQRFTTKDGLVGNTVSDIVQDKNGNLWFGTTSGISRYDGTSWRDYITDDGLVSNIIWTITQDRQGNLWFGTKEGVSCYDGTAWDNFTTENGLADNSVSAIIQDKDGNMWFGTRGGATRYNGNNWRTFDREDGMHFLGNYDRIGAIFQDNQGNIWFGSSYGGVSCYNGTGWSILEIEFPEEMGYEGEDGGMLPTVEVIYQDNQGNLWFGTNGGGVSRFDGTNWYTFTREDGLAGDSISDIFQDKQGSLWFATKGFNGAAFSRYDGKDWQTFTYEDGLLGTYGNAIEEDNYGNLWFGTSGGISGYNGTAWCTFTTRDGLAGSDVRTIFKDNRGNLWIGTYGSGISRYTPTGNEFTAGAEMSADEHGSDISDTCEYTTFVKEDGLANYSFEYPADYRVDEIYTAPDSSCEFVKFSKPGPNESGFNNTIKVTFTYSYDSILEDFNWDTDNTKITQVKVPKTLGGTIRTYIPNDEGIMRRLFHVNYFALNLSVEMLSPYANSVADQTIMEHIIATFQLHEINTIDITVDNASGYNTLTMEKGMAIFSFEYPSDYFVFSYGIDSLGSGVSIGGSTAHKDYRCSTSESWQPWLSFSDLPVIAVVVNPKTINELLPEGTEYAGEIENQVNRLKGMDALQLLSQAEITIDGIKADYYVYSYIWENDPVEPTKQQPEITRLILFEYDELSWCLVMRSHEASASEEEEIFNHFIESFTITKTYPNWPH